MGLIFSRKRALTNKDILESLDNDIKQLTEFRRRNIYQEKSFIIYLLIVSFLFYIVGALIFYVYYRPNNWLEYGLYSIPLVLFPIIIYFIKKLLNMYFTHKKAQYDLDLSSLQEEKRKILNDVMESETFNVARELLQRYDPHNPFLRATRNGRSQDTTPQRRENGELRQRRQQQQQQAQTPRHPALRQQPHPPIMTSQTVPRPTRSSQPRIALPPSQPLPSPNDEAPFRLPQPPAVTTQFPPHHTTQFIPPGMCLGPAPGPPQPSPILPRDRTNLDKMVEYLVGDGPNNRYALVCSECHSHNGMALKDEFGYMSFRCAYCFTLNPARRVKPVLQRPPGNSATGVTTETTESVSSATNQSDITSSGQDERSDMVTETEPAEVEGHTNPPHDHMTDEQ